MFGTKSGVGPKISPALPPEPGPASEPAPIPVPVPAPPPDPGPSPGPPVVPSPVPTIAVGTVASVGGGIASFTGCVIGVARVGTRIAGGGVGATAWDWGAGGAGKATQV